MQAFQASQKNEDRGYFDSLVQTFKTGLMAILETYLDETERSGGVFSVAGYAFAPPQAKKFAKEWRALFGGRICHMTDLVAKRGEFKGIGDSERDRLIQAAVKVINKRIAFGVAVSCNVAEVQRLTPAWIQGFGHAYPICCHWAMAALGIAIAKTGLPDRIVYIFKAGHEYEAEARAFIGHVAAPGSPLKEQFRHHGDAFLPKTDAVPLQAADMLAWEWAKCQDETISTPIRPLRQSLRALFQSAPSRYTVHHMTGKKMAEWLDVARQSGLEQLRETGKRLPSWAR